MSSASTACRTLRALTRLRTLDLGHNALTAVPDLGALTQLEILYLHENALGALPALPPSLTYLNISENPLRDVVLGRCRT